MFAPVAAAFTKIMVAGGTGDSTNPGSLGASSDPSRVMPGRRMAGRLGGNRKKIQNMVIVKVMPEKNLILVKGSIPGAKGSYVLIEK